MHTMFFIIGVEPEKTEMIFFESGKLRLSNQCDFWTCGFKSSRDTETVNFGTAVADLYLSTLSCRFLEY